MGIASKIEVGGKDFYINNRSFSKFVIRATEIGQVNSAQEAACKLNEIYLNHKKTGYDNTKVKLINDSLKEILSDKKSHDLQQLVLRLKNLA